MRKRKKRIVIVFLFVAAFLAGQPCVSTFASDAQAYLLQSDALRTKLVVEGGQVCCVARVRGQDGTTEIYMTMYLKGVSDKGKVIVDETWSGIRTTKEYLNAIKSCAVKENCTYTLMVVATVVSNGVSETISQRCQLTT
ncbi:MAG: hypothetical protein IJY09_01100 [Lachnospiraceae bacterium]|nr:hypothetical protein [Lachnospiraceae bacterium]